jgi:hypothetical protein
MEAYQKIQQSYKEEVQDIWKGNIIVEEKIDGSQFRVKIDVNGVISYGSHHQEGDMVDSMFKLATTQAEEMFKDLAVKNNHTIITMFCEYLSKPKQNTISYSRVPEKNLILFDLMLGGRYMSRKIKENFVKTIPGLEIVPLLWEGRGSDFTDEIKTTLLKSKSCLGHQAGYDRIEGVVVKNYDQYYDVNKYPYMQGMWLCLKIVNETFQEKNKVENPGVKGKFQILKDRYNTGARWKKAVQHLREKGDILDDMKDMAKIIPEVKSDLILEEKETIKGELWELYSHEIIGNSVRGLPEWYKKELMK